MKKKLLLFSFCALFVTSLLQAQVGIGTPVPHPSAALEINSYKGGILIPRMTQANRDSIVLPAPGLMIYQTDGDKGFYFYDGSRWALLSMSYTLQQNINTNGKWISGNGKDSGLYLHNGFAGINTRTPDRPLSINGNGPSGELLSFKSGNVTRWHLNFFNNRDLNIAESGVADGRLYLQKGGNIGIGTTEPGSLLTVKGKSGSFISTFENTEGSEGDGIQIKLSRLHPAYKTNGQWLNLPNPVAELYARPAIQIRDWVFAGQQFNWRQLMNLYPNSILAGTGFNIANVVIDGINANRPNINIPSRRILDRTTIFGGLSLPGPDIPAIEIPELNTPAISVQMPAFPRLPEAFPTLGNLVPQLSFENANGNSLSNKNKFLSFVDKDNRELGSVRAQSVKDWQMNFLSTDYFTKMVMSMVGLDLANSVSWAAYNFTELASSYNSLGVEYVSGHGDYAEWLERIDPSEAISSGDIIGVKAGKITKDLAGAEQVLAVSTNPIVLGNAPEDEKLEKGNKIAFMGQVPVKVLGPIQAGDYIVARSNVAGYGVAVKPADLTAEDLKLTVGRAWETNPNEGAKTVNTLIGVDKADYARVVGGMDARLKFLEGKLAALTDALKQNADSHGGKKKKQSRSGAKTF